MICWSCERATGDGATCANCNAILPPDSAMDFFRVLGIPRKYQLDLGTAESRFRELSRQFHPDRFAKADPRARRASLQRSVQLNEAWRTIKDPVRRAEYLLQLAGYRIGAEKAGAGPARNAESDTGAARREPIPVPPALLAEILELREQLGDARAEGDDVRVETMATEMRGRLGAALGRVAAALDQVESEPSESTHLRAELWEAATRELIAIRYFRRFLDEILVHEEAVADRATGAPHG